MTAVLQRVSHASVTVDSKVCGKIDNGILILLGVKNGDAERDATILADKISKLRIFSDDNGKMNLSVKDIDGGVLVISNFTLLANYKKGNRPDYMNGAKPDEANRLYEYFCDYISTLVPTQRGIFGADMKVELLNDGPVTIVMDSEVLK
ncbi:MAG: D-tyrosyl-tRNA(Tyr) deacylase [Clostridia bacterium]|nr:D-tyrosyl-tRNA(Tyr) deacylase [Clostridia bacterium]